MSRYAILREIKKLDPEKDDQRIVFLSSRYDFPFDTTRALEFALFRTFCVPSISALLDRTAEFLHRAQKRYDDTDIIVSELMEWGYDSERGKRALRRLNQLHGRFAIANEDFLYVLSTFIYEPIRWNERFGGWFPRFLTPLVRSAIYALLDDSLIAAFGFPRPSPLMRRLVPGALRLRGRLAGLLPARRAPRLRTEMGHPTYRDGYVIERLGPPEAG